MEVEERLKLLAKPYWSYKDIQAYFGCCQAKACNLKRKAILEYNGAIQYYKDKVRTESIMLMMGTTRNDEIASLKQILQEEKEEDETGTQETRTN